MHIRMKFSLFVSNNSHSQGSMLSSLRYVWLPWMTASGVWSHHDLGHLHMSDWLIIDIIYIIIIYICIWYIYIFVYVCICICIYICICRMVHVSRISESICRRSEPLTHPHLDTPTSWWIPNFWGTPSYHLASWYNAYWRLLLVSQVEKRVYLKSENWKGCVYIYIQLYGYIYIYIHIYIHLFNGHL